MQAKYKRDYISRLKTVYDKLVGPGWFEMIPAIDLDIIYEKRSPSLTIKMASGAVIDADLASLSRNAIVSMKMSNWIPYFAKQVAALYWMPKIFSLLSPNIRRIAIRWPCINFSAQIKIYDF